MPKYEFNTNLIKSGDILGVHQITIDPITKGIQLLTKGQCNHVAIFDQPDGEELCVYEAKMSGGFVKTPIEDYLKQWSKNELDLCVVRVNKLLGQSDYDYHMMVDTAVARSKSWLGKKYDVTAIIGFSFICWAKILGRKSNAKANWLAKKDKLFCSESVCKAYYQPEHQESIFIGIHDKEATCATISPKDVMKSANVSFVTGDARLLKG